jgi:hypothetical protein
VNVVDPFAMLQAPANYDRAVAVALQSNAAEYIRFQILDHLVDVGDNDDIETEFTKGYQMALRVAFIAAGGQVDGSEESWAELVKEHRGGS